MQGAISSIEGLRVLNPFFRYPAKPVETRRAGTRSCRFHQRDDLPGEALQLL
jgi:hypothetical protein